MVIHKSNSDVSGYIAAIIYKSEERNNLYLISLKTIPEMKETS
jgi:hypothetical protein